MLLQAERLQDAVADWLVDVGYVVTGSHSIELLKWVECGTRSTSGSSAVGEVQRVSGDVL